MPIPTPLDHLLVAVLVGALPFYGAWEYKRLVARVRAGIPDARAREYRSTMVVQWAVALGLMAVWWGVGRSFQVLGVALPGGAPLVVGATVTLLAVLLLLGQWRAVAGMDEQGLEGVRAQTEPVADFLPHTPHEAVLFRGLAVTAGICEEVVYRGYLIWYLASFVGPWPAALLGGALFGVLHLYQGAAGVLKTGVVGLVAALLYMGTGSLLWPMIVHVAVDLNGGAVAYRVLGREQVVAGPA